MLSLLRGFTVGILPPVHHAEQGITPRRLPRPPRGPASSRRGRVRYFYPNLASTPVGSHSTAATSSSPPTSSRPSSRPTRKPPPRKNNPRNTKEKSSNPTTKGVCCRHPFLFSPSVAGMHPRPLGYLFLWKSAFLLRIPHIHSLSLLPAFYAPSLCLLCTNSNLLKIISIYKTPI